MFETSDEGRQHQASSGNPYPRQKAQGGGEEPQGRPWRPGKRLSGGPRLLLQTNRPAAAGRGKKGLAPADRPHRRSPRARRRGRVLARPAGSTGTLKFHRPGRWGRAGRRRPEGAAPAAARLPARLGVTGGGAAAAGGGGARSGWRRATKPPWRAGVAARAARRPAGGENEGGHAGAWIRVGHRRPSSPYRPRLPAPSGVAAVGKARQRLHRRGCCWRPSRRMGHAAARLAPSPPPPPPPPVPLIAAAVAAATAACRCCCRRLPPRGCSGGGAAAAVAQCWRSLCRPSPPPDPPLAAPPRDYASPRARWRRRWEWRTSVAGVVGGYVVAASGDGGGSGGVRGGGWRPSDATRPSPRGVAAVPCCIRRRAGGGERRLASRRGGRWSA